MSTIAPRPGADLYFVTVNVQGQDACALRFAHPSNAVVRREQRVLKPRPPVLGDSHVASQRFRHNTVLLDQLNEVVREYARPLVPSNAASLLPSLEWQPDVLDEGVGFGNLTKQVSLRIVGEFALGTQIGESVHVGGSPADLAAALRDALRCRNCGFLSLKGLTVAPSKKGTHENAQRQLHNAHASLSYKQARKLPCADHMDNLRREDVEVRDLQPLDQTCRFKRRAAFRGGAL